MKKVALVLIFNFVCLGLFAQSPGQIVEAATPATNPLDPNGDGFITISGAPFAGTPTFEENEFEINYQRIPQFETEPDSDIQTGANCGSSDILSSSVTLSGHSYIFIDAANNRMLFRARLGRNPSGAFGYSFLFDTDILFGSANTDPLDDDPNAIAGNHGFEVEVIFATGGGNSGVRV